MRVETPESPVCQAPASEQEGPRGPSLPLGDRGWGGVASGAPRGGGGGGGGGEGG